jgi:CRISPR-associated endonuclease/helicase Cas3
MSARPPKFIAHHRASDGHWQSLAEHLTGVGARSGAFADALGLASLGELLGLLHDLGKYSQAFQAYLKSAVGELNQDEDEDWVDAVALKGKVDHSTAGAQMVWQSLSARGPAAHAAAQVAALCIASHHSGLIDCIAADEARFGEDGFTQRMKKSGDKSHLDEAQQAADAHILDRCSYLIADSAMVANLTRVLRSIGEVNRTNGAGAQATFQQIGLLIRFVFSCLIDADRIDTADFEHPPTAHTRPAGTYVGWPTLIDRFERHLEAMTSSRPIDALRRDISAVCRDAAIRSKGIYTLTVPTGGGKTLASLRFALHHAQQRRLARIVYIIPFTSIIDQNADVVRSILEPVNLPQEAGRVVLEHHGSITPERQTWREKVLCENWDAPVVYTTMVQFLESLFGSGTRGARRMHQLANAVLIFDEIQTLPINCVHLFNNAVNFLAEQCNSTVLLCTATQPILHAVRPDQGAIRLADKHELMPDVRALFEQLQRVELRDRRRPGGWPHCEIAQLALDEVRQSQSCLVIVNTKAAARRLFELTSTSLDEDSVCHLSTDMCPAHRKHELARVRSRLAAGLPILCISTQLIEAGVDVDFRVVIRFLAGLDSIAQAAGRCNRNGNRARGVVHVLNPDEEALGALPDIRIGRDQAQRVLDDYQCDPSRYNGNIFDPSALSDYYRHYFFERQDEMSYAVSARDIGHDDSLLELLSTNGQAVAEHATRFKTMPTLPFRQAFMTAAKAFKAIDAPTQGIVVPYGEAGRELINNLCAAFDAEHEFDLLRTAQQYTVNVFPNVLRDLLEARAVREVKPDTRILCLDPRYYSARFGLAIKPVAPMETLNV